jgi:hypothetical protein
MSLGCGYTWHIPAISPTCTYPLRERSQFLPWRSSFLTTAPLLIQLYNQMALPKKGLRKITVDNHLYAWSATGNDEGIGLTVASVACTGQLLTGRFEYHSKPIGASISRDGSILFDGRHRLVIALWVLVSHGFPPLAVRCGWLEVMSTTPSSYLRESLRSCPSVELPARPGARRGPGKGRRTCQVHAPLFLGPAFY